VTLPTFVVIGAMKAGTTSLHRYLGAHPDVFVPELKEIEFFSEPDRWRLGVDWYERLFADGAGVTARGEVSTGYTKLPRYPEAAERLHSVVPDARLVYLVREPIERLQSHYVHNVLQGFESRPIADALTQDDNYVSTSAYMTQLRRYLDLFGRDRILVVLADELRAARAATMATMFGFLGVDGSVAVEGLDEEHYATDSRRAVRGWARPLTTNRRVQIVRGRLPGSVRKVLGRTLQRPVTDIAVDLPDDVLADLRTRLRPEVDGLRALVGDLPAAWTSWR
jgi:hypothetical protein